MGLLGTSPNFRCLRMRESVGREHSVRAAFLLYNLILCATTSSTTCDSSAGVARLRRLRRMDSHHNSIQRSHNGRRSATEKVRERSVTVPSSDFSSSFCELPYNGRLLSPALIFFTAEHLYTSKSDKTKIPNCGLCRPRPHASS